MIRSFFPLSLMSAALVFGAVNADASPRPLDPRFEQERREGSLGEAEMIEMIRRGILGLQASYGQQEGRLMRGTHSKGVCTRGEFEVLDTRNPRLSRGIFAHPGRYPAVFRFANGGSRIAPDQDPDVRALSIAIDLPEALRADGITRQDFSMNNAPTFPIRDAYVFALLMKAAADRSSLSVREGILVAEAFARGALQQRQALRPFQTYTYWSGVPFAFGSDDVIKYRAVPCEGMPQQSLRSDEADSLSQELRRMVREDAQRSGACFDFQIQFLVPGQVSLLSRLSAVEMVEDATLEWDDARAPFQTVARLHFVPNGQVEDAPCESLQISTGRNTQFPGLGSINRARTIVEEASANRRLQGARPAQ